MGRLRGDAAIAVLVFALAGIWGGVFWAGFVKAGHHPSFYQSYFEPAVMLACGKGFLISQPQQPPALRAFLYEQTDRFSCDQLPPDLVVGTSGLYQGPWRYMLTTVAIAWMILGITWSGLAPLFGVLFGVTTALAYGVCRQIAGRAASAACATALGLSTLQLTNLPNLRDYAKAPFTLALVLILVTLVVHPRRPRAVLLLALAYGLVMGVGYGFRTDLLIDIPPFLIAVALFMPGGVLRNLPLKIAATAVFFAGFVAAGWPIIMAVARGGGCQWHVFLLGLTTPFNDILGVGGGAYEWGHLYKDEYLWTTVSSYASRFRPGLGDMYYCSHEYDIASWAYLRQILLIFPADMVTRAYAAVLHVLNLPFEWVDPPFSSHGILLYRVRAHGLAMLNHTGPFLAAAFVLAVSWSSLRLALFAVFVILYFGGYPAIQFLPRHYFPFEIITWALLAFLVERGVYLVAALGRKSKSSSQPRTTGDVRRVVACAVLVPLLLVVPLWALRWYQNGRATRLLESYVTSPAVPMSLVPGRPGSFQLPVERTAGVPRPGVSVASGHLGTIFAEVVLNAAVCRPGTTVAFRYDPGVPITDFSRTVALQPAAEGAGPTRIFEAVYTGFKGIDVSDPSPGCLESVSVLTNLDRLPLLLSAQLPPGWASRPQYQRIIRLE